MATIDELRNKIISAGAAKRAAENEKQRAKEQYEAKLRTEIEEAAKEVLPELYELAQMLYEQRIELPEMFITCSLGHKLGFFVRGYYDREITGFGNEGGGLCGCDFKLDFDGNIISPETGLDSYHFMERFCDNLAVFRIRFYDYINNL